MFSKYLAFATILLFLGVGIKPAIATVLPDEKMEVEYYEMDGNREQVPQNGFCILLVYAWGLTEWLVPVPAPFFPLIYIGFKIKKIFLSTQKLTSTVKLKK